MGNFSTILDVDYGLLMYENKDNSEMKWYKVEKNPEWWDIIQWQAKRMREMAQDDRKMLPPPRCKKSSYECKNCDFRTLCHKSSVWNKPDLESKIKNFYKALL